VNVTALITGLGIGGVAIALALQAVLGDLFASLSIVLDKPFVIGDFITVGEFAGTVEHVGLKTTRVRSLSGEQVIFSNSDLLNGRIRNFKRMSERRILFGVGVTYQTPLESLRKIPGMIRAIVEGQSKTRFDRCHFKGFGDSSFDIETVYFVLDPDYAVYMDIQQAINFEIIRQFTAEGITFAYPTRTLFVAGDGKTKNGTGTEVKEKGFA
jgi:small-conductance mechanosensitive channel